MCEQPPLFIEHSLIPGRQIQIIYDKGGLLVARLNKIKIGPQKFSRIDQLLVARSWPHRAHK